MVLHRRSLMLLVLTVAIATVGPSVAGATPVPAAHTAKKKKKAKKPVPLTATVSGTFSIREDIEGGFGNDNGPNWQQLKVEVKNVEIPFTGAYRFTGGAEVTATFTYHAEASTADRSYHLGCDSETRKSDGTWTGKTTVVVKEATWLQTNGKSKRFAGWQVYAQPPEQGIPLVSKGSYTDWESILMTNCQSFDANAPLGLWRTDFAQPDGVGGLAADNRSVPLMSIDTDKGQTGTASGKLRFNKAPR